MKAFFWSTENEGKIDLCPPNIFSAPPQSCYSGTKPELLKQQLT